LKRGRLTLRKFSFEHIPHHTAPDEPEDSFRRGICLRRDHNVNAYKDAGNRATPKKDQKHRERTYVFIGHKAEATSGPNPANWKPVQWTLCIITTEAGEETTYETVAVPIDLHFMLNTFITIMARREQSMLQQYLPIYNLNHMTNVIETLSANTAVCNTTFHYLKIICTAYSHELCFLLKKTNTHAGVQIQRCVPNQNVPYNNGIAHLVDCSGAIGANITDDEKYDRFQSLMNDVKDGAHMTMVSDRLDTRDMYVDLVGARPMRDVCFFVAKHTGSNLPNDPIARFEPVLSDIYFLT
jgi:hypothetical protein